MTKGDIAIVAAALTVVVLIYVVLHAFPPNAALTAVVRVDGKEVARLKVDGPTLSKTEVQFLSGPATIEYGQGKVRVLPLPTHVCPNGICWKTGWISRTGQSIVCVPNHATITLEGGTDQVDSVIR